MRYTELSDREWRKLQVLKAAQLFYPGPLTEEGFVCYNGENLSWYRLVNNEVLQCVYLYTASASIMVLDMGFSVLPLYLKPPLPLKWNTGTPNYPSWIQMMEARRLKIYDVRVISREIPVSYIYDDGGISILREHIFPIFDKTTTEEDVYRFHKGIVTNRDYNFIAPTDINFAKEVLYWGDENLYEEALSDAKHILYVADILPFRYLKAQRKEAEQIINAIENNEREAYLELLEKQRQKVIKDLKKKLGIEVSSNIGDGLSESK